MNGLNSPKSVFARERIEYEFPDRVSYTVTFYRLRPISEPISHLRLRSIRFLRFPRRWREVDRRGGHRISLSFSLLFLFSPEKRANVNRDSFNVNPWKARERWILYISDESGEMPNARFRISRPHIPDEIDNRSRRIDGVRRHWKIHCSQTAAIYRRPVWVLQRSVRAFLIATC